MSKVVALLGQPIPLKQGEPNLEIVESLELLLDEARSGKLLALAYCTYKSVDHTSTGWVTGAYAFNLSSAISSLDYRYNKMLDGG